MDQIGSKLIKACKFCVKCGAKIKTVVVEKSTENASSAGMKYFNDYFDLRSNKKNSFFKKNGKERWIKTLQARNQLRSVRF